jgi:23S rRNA maturation mini-RNase III
MYDYTSNNWSHRNSNEKHKEKSGSCTRKTFDRFTTKEAILGTSHIIRKLEA